MNSPSPPKKTYRPWVSAFGAGLSPFAPGTCGSLVVAAIFLTLALTTRSPELLAAIMLATAIYGSVITIIFANRAVAEHGPDPGIVVSDELAGQALTYLWLWPLADWTTSQIIAIALVGFVLFRIFDIIKPPPVRQLEKVKDPYGILLDDLAAGIYANLTLHVILYLGLLKCCPA